MSSKHRSQKGKVQTVGNKNVTSFKIYIYIMYWCMHFFLLECDNTVVAFKNRIFRDSEHS